MAIKMTWWKENERDHKWDEKTRKMHACVETGERVWFQFRTGNLPKTEKNAMNLCNLMCGCVPPLDFLLNSVFISFSSRFVRTDSLSFVDVSFTHRAYYFSFSSDVFFAYYFQFYSVIDYSSYWPQLHFAHFIVVLQCARSISFTVQITQTCCVLLWPV